MRRALVLTCEAARHPFRASLPAHVFVPGEVENRRPWRESLGFEKRDLVLAVQTYCACFVAATVFFY